MKPLLSHLKRPLLHVAGFSFFINLLLLIPAIFMLQVFDRVLVSRSTDTLLVLALGAGIGLLLLMALDYVRARLQGVAGNVIAETLSPVVTKLTVAQAARRSGKPLNEGLRDIGTLRAAFSAQGLLAVGAYLVITGQASPGVTIACTILLGRALQPVEQVVGSWKVLVEARAAFARLTALLDSAAAEPRRMELPAPRGELVAHQLAYRPLGTERVLLAGVSLQLAAGESLAIIGPSGAGKSTLLRLLTGVWAPTAGVVRLDGSDLAQWPREQLGPWLGYVPQDVELFAGSVAENIARLGEVDSAKVVAAAQRARVHEMIQSLPDGYDTPVDPTSALLSPGQRQRIALARALYGDPRLLILDEPNSNLDGAGEIALAEALKALRGQVTVVVVTHRTTLVQHVDKMLVIEAGRTQHYGSVAEVMKAMQAKAQGQSPAGANVVAMPMAAASAMEKAS